MRFDVRHRATPGFGRLDATLVAVVPPNDHACADLNSTHLVIQGEMNGDVDRMVVDVLSNQGSPDVWFYELDAPLVGEPWAEGWHTDVPLDYATTLGLHSTQFTEMTETPLVTAITNELTLGAKVSIFATNGSTEPDSAHLIHRNTTNQDGAIVLSPDGAPHWLTMRFDEDVF